VDLFAFVGWFVAVVCAVTVAWPLNVPLMALAYKVRRGSEPLDLEARELWTRSALGRQKGGKTKETKGVGSRIERNRAEPS
jgi:hypothetical protein